jgi:hypothetical protein
MRVGVIEMRIVHPVLFWDEKKILLRHDETFK